jgi:hypothetical protein
VSRRHRGLLGLLRQMIGELLVLTARVVVHEGLGGVTAMLVATCRHVACYPSLCCGVF